MITKDRIDKVIFDLENYFTEVITPKAVAVKAISDAFDKAMGDPLRFYVEKNIHGTDFNKLGLVDYCTLHYCTENPVTGCGRLEGYIRSAGETFCSYWDNLAKYYGGFKDCDEVRTLFIVKDELDRLNAALDNIIGCKDRIAASVNSYYAELHRYEEQIDAKFNATFGKADETPHKVLRITIEYV